MTDNFITYLGAAYIRDLTGKYGWATCILIIDNHGKINLTGTGTCVQGGISWWISTVWEKHISCTVVFQRFVYGFTSSLPRFNVLLASTWQVHLSVECLVPSTVGGSSALYLRQCRQCSLETDWITPLRFININIVSLCSRLVFMVFINVLNANVWYDFLSVINIMYRCFVEMSNIYLTMYLNASSWQLRRFELHEQTVCKYFFALQLESIELFASAPMLVNHCWISHIFLLQGSNPHPQSAIKTWVSNSIAWAHKRKTKRCWWYRFD